MVIKRKTSKSVSTIKLKSLKVGSLAYAREWVKVADKSAKLRGGYAYQKKK